MPLKIRFFHVGHRNRRVYRIVVADTRHSRQSENYIEQLGLYDTKPRIETGKKEAALDFERLKYWIGRGAQVSEGVQRVISQAGIMPPPAVIVPKLWDPYLVEKSKKSIEKYYIERYKILGDDA